MRQELNVDSSILYKAIEVLSPLLLALLGWLSVKLAQLINARVEQEYLRGVLVRLTDAVFTVVKELDQTLVTAMKDANRDGKLTDSEKAEIKLRAVATVKAYLGMKGIEAIAKVLGLSSAGVDNFISAKVEAAVHDLRSVETATRPFAPRPSAT